ncbi:MAG: hypothetical protein H8E34_01690 [Bacteroidetes bacterium]|nr:hypothetical protein [Bacteroidota bacterium]MBL6943148.1 hypothetical protein [Bacteroidales bacterium]
MKPFSLFLLVLLLINSCYNPSSSDIISDLKVLNGEWQSYKGVKFNENWKFVDENLFEGIGFSMNGADTAFFESLKILREGDSIYYRVFLGEKKDIVDFLLIQASKNNWTFVNPANEFPSIIVYQVENDSLLTVTTSDINSNKKQLFYLKKVN